MMMTFEDRFAKFGEREQHACNLLVYRKTLQNEKEDKRTDTEKISNEKNRDETRNEM